MSHPSNSRMLTGAIRTSAAVALLAALIGCSNTVQVSGTYDEVWQRSQQAMTMARFASAPGGARFERVERNHEAGVLKYVWSDAGNNKARVVTLSIAPTAETPGAACPALDRTITVDALAWGFFGWAQTSDPRTVQEVVDALMVEFAREPPAVASIEPPP